MQDNRTVGQQLEENIATMDEDIASFTNNDGNNSTTTNGNNNNNNGGGNNGGNGTNNGAPDTFNSPNINDEMRGISSAYGINPVELEASKKQSHIEKKNYPQPPERKKGEDKGKDKDIMAYFYDMILDFYGWCIDTVVDIPLDFIDWVLYARKEEASEEKKEGETLLDVSNRLLKKDIDLIKKKDEDIIKFHKEMVDNLDLVRAGATPVWTVAASEPAVYANIKSYFENVLIPMQTVAIQNPDSPEAKRLEYFKRFPEVVEVCSKKTQFVTKLSRQLASIDLLTRTTTSALPDAFNDAFEKIQEHISERNPNMNTIIADSDQMLAFVTNNADYTDVKDKLDAIKQEAITSRNSKKIKKLIKEINKTIKEKEKTPAQREKIITEKSAEYMKKIFENVDKIYETQNTNGEDNNETIKKYFEHMYSSIKNISKDVVAIDKDESERHKTNSKLKTRARQAIESVNNFAFNGTEIGSMNQATQSSVNLYEGNKLHEMMLTFATRGRA